MGQTGVIALAAPATAVLVTDGVTGDWPPDLLEPRDLERALAAASAQAAAERCIAIARKHDGTDGRGRPPAVRAVTDRPPARPAAPVRRRRPARTGRTPRRRRPAPGGGRAGS